MYVGVYLRDTFSGIRRACASGFGKEIVGIVSKETVGDVFGGISFGGRIYINLGSHNGFMQILGHELLHELRKDRPDLYDFFALHARQHYINLPEYIDRLNAMMGPQEDQYSHDKAEEELLADFTGDALADTSFLDRLARADYSLFKQFVEAVTRWLVHVGKRMSGDGLGSSEYFHDVETLRVHLAEALVRYARNEDFDSPLYKSVRPPRVIAIREVRV
jgi:hypothetical protein